VNNSFNYFHGIDKIEKEKSQKI